MKNSHKLFVISILTSDPLRLKILQSIFASARQSKAFRRWEKGRRLENHAFSLKRTRSDTPFEPTLWTILQQISTERVPRSSRLTLVLGSYRADNFHTTEIDLVQSCACHIRSLSSV